MVVLDDSTVSDNSTQIPENLTSKPKNWIIFSASIFLLIIILGTLIYFLAAKKVQKKPTVSIPEPTSLQNIQTVIGADPALKNQVVYEKEVEKVRAGSQSYTIRTIYRVNPDGTDKQEIFTVGQEGINPSAYFLAKDKNWVVVNLNSSLVAYNALTGEKQTLFTGDKATDQITGFAVSNDSRILALSVTVTDQPDKSLPRRAQKINRVVKIILIDLDSLSQQTIVSKNFNELNLFLGLKTWIFSADDKEIYLHELAGGEGYFSHPVWSVDLSGQELRKLPANLGRISPDKFLIVTSPPISEAFDLSEAGCGFGAYEPNTLRLFDLQIEKEKILEENETKDILYKDITWSPDSQQFLYTSTRWKSINPKECEEEFYPEEYNLYDLTTGKSQKVTSEKEILNNWYPGKPEVRVNRDKIGDQLLINGQVIDSTTNTKYENPQNHLLYEDQYYIRYIDTF